MEPDVRKLLCEIINWWSKSDELFYERYNGSIKYFYSKPKFVEDAERIVNKYTYKALNGYSNMEILKIYDLLNKCHIGDNEYEVRNFQIIYDHISSFDDEVLDELIKCYKNNKEILWDEVVEFDTKEGIVGFLQSL